jgi:hypothetical protein
VTPGIPTIASDRAPRTKQLMWSPISSTLISGKRDAVLVDTFITVEQADILVNWVAASGKNLTTIYVTRGRARGDSTDKLVELYPDRVNPGGALGLFGAHGQIVNCFERKEFSYAAIATHSSRRTF